MNFENIRLEDTIPEKRFIFCLKCLTVLFLLFISSTLSADIITLQDGTVVNADIVGKIGDWLYVIVWLDAVEPMMILHRADILSIYGLKGNITESVFQEYNWLSGRYHIDSFSQKNPVNESTDFSYLLDKDIGEMTEVELIAFRRIFGLSNLGDTTSVNRQSPVNPKSKNWYIDVGIGMGPSSFHINNEMVLYDSKRDSYEYGIKIGFIEEDSPIYYIVEFLGLIGGGKYSAVYVSDMIYQYYIAPGIIINQPRFLQGGASMGWSFGSWNVESVFGEKNKHKLKAAKGVNAYIAADFSSERKGGFLIGVRYLYLGGKLYQVDMNSKTVGSFIRWRF
jgi:hypothetical protein